MALLISMMVGMAFTKRDGGLAADMSPVVEALRYKCGKAYSVVGLIATGLLMTYVWVCHMCT